MAILVLDILTTAAILFAVSAGLLIILGVMKLINFAHGVNGGVKPGHAAAQKSAS
ncbi:hypothetical protein [Paracoccus versutus]|uniref:hypothetical protein n=1 Tax=Paracoccus versutus TaxID=34007 RepID=UPI001AD7FBE0|nr:hypothetical protein [Paracoccus versutus]